MTRRGPVLYCHCAFTENLPDATRRAALAALVASGREFEAVADLCELAQDKDPLLAKLAAADGLTVLACYPRAVRWLFAAAGAPLPEEGVEIVNLREAAAADVASALGEPAGAADPDRVAALRLRLESRAGDAKAAEKAWFPVLDRDRCRDCRQCMNFCIFGVYNADGGRIEVVHGENCKLNCPACARVCPATAIIFPKHPSGPMSGSDEPGGELTAVDLKKALAGDVFEVLRRRQEQSTGRFSAAMDVERAKEERAHCSCTADILRDLGVSPEAVAAEAARAADADRRQAEGDAS